MGGSHSGTSCFSAKRRILGKRPLIGRPQVEGRRQEKILSLSAARATAGVIDTPLTILLARIDCLNENLVCLTCRPKTCSGQKLARAVLKSCSGAFR